MDVSKLCFLGAVEYAQHNFARLRPLLYSTDGRLWEGEADGGWFPNQGLVFCLVKELRYAHQGSLWTFRVSPNTRADSADKDLFIAGQAKPAHEFLTQLEVSPSEALARLINEEGVARPAGDQGGVLLPEDDGRWVLVPELVEVPGGRHRAAPGKALRHLKVFQGSLETLAGMATEDGRWVLPPVQPAAADLRNWQPAAEFIDTFAADLRGWIPHGKHRAAAVAAATALRELSPSLSATSALRSPEARAALQRAVQLSASAELASALADDFAAGVRDSDEFKAHIEAERERALRVIEAEVAEAADQLKADAVTRLRADHARLEQELSEGNERLVAIREEVQALETRRDNLLAERGSELEKLTKAVEKVVARAKREPAALVADWMATNGISFPEASASSATPPTNELAPPARAIASSGVGPALYAASPATNTGQPRLLVAEAALRSRELPLLIGGLAREHAESLIWVCGGGNPVVISPDPTVLSLAEMLPTGPRGARAPLGRAFERALTSPDRPVIVLLDDIDPVSSSFWLPELARAYKSPGRHQLPSNLLFLAIMEARPSDMALTMAQAAELFPLTFSGCAAKQDWSLEGEPTEIELAAVAPPLRTPTAPERVKAFEVAARVTFSEEVVRSMTDSFAAHLLATRTGASLDEGRGELADLLAQGCRQLTSNRSD